MKPAQNQRHNFKQIDNILDWEIFYFDVHFLLIVIIIMAVQCSINILRYTNDFVILFFCVVFWSNISDQQKRVVSGAVAFL